MTLPTFPGLAELNKLAENKGKKVRRLAQSQKLSEWKRNVALKPLKWKMVKQARRDGKVSMNFEPSICLVQVLCAEIVLLVSPGRGSVFRRRHPRTRRTYRMLERNSRSL